MIKYVVYFLQFIGRTIGICDNIYGKNFESNANHFV